MENLIWMFVAGLIVGGWSVSKFNPIYRRRKEKKNLQENYEKRFSTLRMLIEAEKAKLSQLREIAMDPEHDKKLTSVGDILNNEEIKRLMGELDCEISVSKENVSLSSKFLPKSSPISIGIYPWELRRFLEVTSAKPEYYPHPSSSKSR